MIIILCVLVSLVQQLCATDRYLRYNCHHAIVECGDSVSLLMEKGLLPFYPLPLFNRSESHEVRIRIMSDEELGIVQQYVTDNKQPVAIEENTYLMYLLKRLMQR